MSNHLDTLYVVRGISRLTGTYEDCSTPCTKDVADSLIAKWKQIPAHRRDYTRLRLEPFTPPVYK